MTAPRPRIIERWFPCAEVSAASTKGWGSSNRETLIMCWFAKRPLAQSRAAVLCSLLPWPEVDQEQERVKAVIREGLNSCQDPDWSPNLGRDHKYGIKDCARYDKSGGYDAARADIIALIAEHYPNGAEMLDPFCGRGLIPLEAARYGISAHAVDYSPVAALASRLLIDWPFRNWDDEPVLPLALYDPAPWQLGKIPRLSHDIAFVQRVVGERWKQRVDSYYPDSSDGEKPWGYLWVSVIPCSECGREFPLYGSNELRRPNDKQADRGQSFELEVDGDVWNVRVVSGLTEQAPTSRRSPGRSKGKSAWCPFPGCGHVHELAEHRSLSGKHFARVKIVVVADIAGTQKVFRSPTADELAAAKQAEYDLAQEPLINGLAPIPDEAIGICNGTKVQATLYGATTFADLSVPRQNLAHAHLARTIDELGHELGAAGISPDYVAALTGYCGAVLARKLNRSTRGAALEPASQKIRHLFVNEASLAFNYDSFESGAGRGPGTWASVGGVPKAVTGLAQTKGSPGRVSRGSATSLSFPDKALDAVVTDPPYVDMIDYADCSDLWFVWLRRALRRHHLDFALTADSRGGQEKTEEIIVKFGYTADPCEHRTPAWYDEKIQAAFAEQRRVVRDDGVVTIVFGHSEPHVWRRLLGAITNAGLILTGAWPANTEKGGQAGSANINTTLTLSCRPVPPHEGPRATLPRSMPKCGRWSSLGCETFGPLRSFPTPIKRWPPSARPWKSSAATAVY